jgi:hypothetical protein
MVGVVIFITNVLSCASAAPDVSVQAAAKAPAAAAAAAAARIKDLPVLKRMSVSLVAGLFCFCLAALPARTLEDRRMADNGNSVRCGEPT